MITLRSNLLGGYMEIFQMLSCYAVIVVISQPRKHCKKVHISSLNSSKLLRTSRDHLEMMGEWSSV